LVRTRPSPKWYAISISLSLSLSLILHLLLHIFFNHPQSVHVALSVALPLPQGDDEDEESDEEEDDFDAEGATFEPEEDWWHLLSDGLQDNVVGSSFWSRNRSTISCSETLPPLVSNFV
jgi:hypothetical protein